ncbi:TPA: recombinase family protein, partial [Legionella pneumophila]
MDTKSSSGRLVFHIFGALAEFERNLIRERTQAGLKAARAKGKIGSRTQKLSTEKAKLVQDLYNEKTRTIKEICELLGISKP